MARFDFPVDQSALLPGEQCYVTVALRCAAGCISYGLCSGAAALFTCLLNALGQVPAASGPACLSLTQRFPQALLYWGAPRHAPSSKPAQHSMRSTVCCLQLTPTAACVPVCSQVWRR